MASVVAYTGLIPQVLEYGESGTGQTFKDGDPVLLHTDGQVRIGASGDFFGIARRDAEGVDGTKIPVELLNLNEIYVVTCSGTTDLADVGLQVAFDAFSVGAWTVSETVAAAGELTILALHPEDGAKAGGRLLVRFRADEIEARA